MNRILVDLSDAQLRELAQIVAAEKRPRAAVIREAIEAYLVQRKRGPDADVFGLWKDRQIDGLEHQRRLRAEW